MTGTLKLLFLFLPSEILIEILYMTSIFPACYIIKILFSRSTVRSKKSSSEYFHTCTTHNIYTCSTWIHLRYLLMYFLLKCRSQSLNIYLFILVSLAMATQL